MITEERIYQFKRYINLLKTAVDSKDKKQIDEVRGSMELTHEDFMEMPSELIAKYGVIFDKATAISLGTYDEEESQNRENSQKALHLKLGLDYDINDKESENPEEQVSKDKGKQRKYLVLARIYSFIGGVFGLLSIFILFLLLYRLLLWLNWFPDWVSIGISSIVSFLLGGRYYLKNLLVNIFAGGIAYLMLFLILQTEIATWWFILIGVFAFVLLKITDNITRFYFGMSKMSMQS